MIVHKATAINPGRGSTCYPLRSQLLDSRQVLMHCELELEKEYYDRQEEQTVPVQVSQPFGQRTQVFPDTSYCWLIKLQSE